MKDTVPMRHRWRAQVLGWPPDRRARFWAQLQERRQLKPREDEDWAFCSVFREFRQHLLTSGEVQMSELWDGAGGIARPAVELAIEPGDPAAYQRLLRDILQRGRKLLKVEHPAQLRLVTEMPGGLPRDRRDR